MSRSVIVAGNFPQGHAPFAAFGRNVQQKLINNTRCANPPVAPAILGQLLDKFEGTIGKRGPGTASDRKDARAKVETALRQNAAYVEGVAATVAPEEVESTIEGAGFSVKKKGKYDKPAYEVVRDQWEGSVAARVKALGRYGTVMYFHAHSLDDGKSWIDHPPTLETKLGLTGLPVGTWVSFRFRTLQKGVYSDWSQVIRILVH